MSETDKAPSDALTDVEFVRKMQEWEVITIGNYERLLSLALRGAETQEADRTIEAELWGGDQANTAHEERAVREIYRQRLEIERLRTALATARNDALTEAAKECERPTDGLYKQGLRWREWDECAAAIRSLITKPTIEGE